MRDILGGPDRDLQAVSGEIRLQLRVRLELGPRGADGGVLARGGGQLALDAATDRGRARRVGGADDGE